MYYVDLPFCFNLARKNAKIVAILGSFVGFEAICRKRPNAKHLAKEFCFAKLHVWAGALRGAWPTALNILFRASGPPSLVGADYGKPDQRSALARFAP
jgi:hypothetical protein